MELSNPNNRVLQVEEVIAYCSIRFGVHLPSLPDAVRCLVENGVVDPSEAQDPHIANGDTQIITRRIVEREKCSVEDLIATVTANDRHMQPARLELQLQHGLHAINDAENAQIQRVEEESRQFIRGRQATHHENCLRIQMTAVEAYLQSLQQADPINRLNQFFRN